MGDALLIRPIATNRQPNQKSSSRKDPSGRDRKSNKTNDVREPEDVRGASSGKDGEKIQRISDDNQKSSKIFTKDSDKSKKNEKTTKKIEVSESSRKDETKKKGQPSRESSFDLDTSDTIMSLAVSSIAAFEETTVDFNTDLDNDSTFPEPAEEVQTPTGAIEKNEYDTEVEVYDDGHQHTQDEEKTARDSLSEEETRKSEQLDEGISAENENEETENEEEHDGRSGSEGSEGGSDEDEADRDIERDVVRDQGLPIATINLDDLNNDRLPTIDEAERSTDNEEEEEEAENDDNDDEKRGDEKQEEDGDENTDDDDNNEDGTEEEDADENNGEDTGSNRKKGVRFAGSETDTKEEVDDEEEQDEDEEDREDEQNEEEGEEGEEQEEKDEENEQNQEDNAFVEGSDNDSQKVSALEEDADQNKTQNEDELHNEEMSEGEFVTLNPHNDSNVSLRSMIEAPMVMERIENDIHSEGSERELQGDDLDGNAEIEEERYSVDDQGENRQTDANESEKEIVSECAGGIDNSKEAEDNDHVDRDFEFESTSLQSGPDILIVRNGEFDAKELEPTSEGKERKRKRRPPLKRRHSKKNLTEDITTNYNEDEMEKLIQMSVPTISVKDEDGISIREVSTDAEDELDHKKDTDVIQEFEDGNESDQYEEDWDSTDDEMERLGAPEDKCVDQGQEKELEDTDSNNRPVQSSNSFLGCEGGTFGGDTPPPSNMGSHDKKMIDRLRNIASNLQEQKEVLKTVQCPKHQKLLSIRQATVETQGVISIYTEYVKSLTKNVVKISSRLEDIHQTLDDKLKENYERNEDDDEDHFEQERTYRDSLASLKTMVEDALHATARIEEEIREARIQSAHRERERQECWSRVEKMVADSQRSETPEPEPEVPECDDQAEEKEALEQMEEEEPEPQPEYNRLNESMRIFNRMEQVKSWPMFIYKAEPNSYNQGVACVIKAAPGTLEEGDLDVTTISQTEAGPEFLESDEELISDIIVITTTMHDSAYGESWSLAIPHCAPKTMIAKEVTIKSRTSDGWKRLKSQDVILETFKDIRFAQMDVDGASLTLAVVWRPRTDVVVVGKKGTHFTASADQRIAFTFRPGVLRVNTEFVIKVTAMDMATVLDIKQRYPDECQPLLISSPIIEFTQTANQRRQFVRAVTVSVPLPPNLLHRSRPGTAVEIRPKTNAFNKRPNSAFVIGFPRRRDQGERTDQVHLVAKNVDSHWIVRDDVVITQDNKHNDVVFFEMEQPIDKFFLMRTTCFTSKPCILSIANSTEEYLANKSVHFLIRQKPSKQTDLVLVCAARERLDKIAQNLAEQGYTAGPNASREVLLKEGQKVWLCFRGNLKQVNEAHTEFLYNSHIPQIINFQVRQIDDFAQRCIDVYRGFIQFYTEGFIQRGQQSEDKNRGSKDGSKTEWTLGEKLLTELVITIPKPAKGPPKIIGRAPLRLKPDGVIDEQYLRNLAYQLGQEWRPLAASLNIKRARIQAILREHTNKESEEVRYEMLLTWAKRVPRSIDKVEILSSALSNTGRLDLAMELRQMDDIWKRNRLQITDEEQLRKYLVRVAQNNEVMGRWQALAFTLGLRESEIEEIENCYAGTRERCLQALLQWKRSDSEANVLTLIKYLRRCAFISSANELEAMIEPR